MGFFVSPRKFNLCYVFLFLCRRKYNIEVKNRFEVLGDIEDPEEEHDMILETYRDAAKNMLTIERASW